MIYNKAGFTVGTDTVKAAVTGEAVWIGFVRVSVLVAAAGKKFWLRSGATAIAGTAVPLDLTGVFNCFLPHPGIPTAVGSALILETDGGTVDIVVEYSATVPIARLTP